MAALTQDRNTPQRAPDLALDFVDPAAAGVVIHAGALVVLDASGHAAPGTAATGLTARGIALGTVDNSGGAAGDAMAKTRAGIWRLAHDGTITRADIGKTAYIVDDQTVADTTGPLAIQQGQTPGDIVLFEAPNVQALQPKYGEANGIAILEMGLAFVPTSAGDDELKITVK